VTLLRPLVQEHSLLVRVEFSSNRHEAAFHVHDGLYHLKVRRSNRALICSWSPAQENGAGIVYPEPIRETLVIVERQLVTLDGSLRWPIRSRPKGYTLPTFPEAHGDRKFKPRLTNC